MNTEQISEAIIMLIQKNKEIKADIGLINIALNRLNATIRADKSAEIKINEAYQKGLDDGKDYGERGCDGCKWETAKENQDPCTNCRKNYKDQYERKEADDEFDIGDVVLNSKDIRFIVIGVGGYFGDAIGCFSLDAYDHIDIKAGTFAFPRMELTKIGNYLDIERRRTHDA